MQTHSSSRLNNYYNFEEADFKNKDKEAQILIENSIQLMICLTKILYKETSI